MRPHAVSVLVTLALAFRSAAVLARRRKQHPLRWMRWLPVQSRYLRSRSRFRVLRTGNQLGKTTVALADLLWHALGEHPYRVCEQSGEYWVICASWSSSVAIQNKLYALIPPERMRPGTAFTELRGFRGKNPAVEIRHADGTWSVIRFRTTRQGSLNLAGATINGALFDEPPVNQSIWVEVLKRVTATGGWISCAMTPVGAPCEWIRELCEKIPPGSTSPVLEDIHARLTPEALIPEGAREPLRTEDGRVLRDAAWIAEEIRNTPESDVDVRVHGEWMTMLSGRYFTIFQSAQGPGSHVSDLRPTGRVRLVLGLDHGHRPGKQVAILSALVLPANSEESVRVYVLDEYSARTGLETPKDDAIGILAMMKRNGLTWASIDFVNGDRPHMPGSLQAKSNKDLGAQVAKLMKVAPEDLRPAIRTAFKARDSEELGCKWLWYALARPGHFVVHPRCVRTIASFDNFVGPKTVDDEYHDCIDALRYSLQEQVSGRRATLSASAAGFRFG